MVNSRMKKGVMGVAGILAAFALSVTAFGTTARAASVLDTSSMFTNRDLKQSPDTSSATTITVSSGEDVTITEAGYYLVTGTATDTTITVAAGDDDKVQLVLDGLNITNSSEPCIYVSTGEKVFVTTSSDSSLSVTGSYSFAADEKADAAIFSRSDLVLNGTGTLTISSTDTGVESKDDLKITGGTYQVTSTASAFKANDSIRVADGVLNITAGTDGLHAENEDDDTLGYVYIAGGTISINAGDDGIHGNSIVQIDGGAIYISAVEGIEGTYIQINGGTIDIYATDDGINASQKSSSYSVVLEITGGTLSISMAAGDTDALDSNGDLIISGGYITISATSAFDYDGTGTLSGGTVIVNGTEVTVLTPSDAMMGDMNGQQGMEDQMDQQGQNTQQGVNGQNGTMNQETQNNRNQGVQNNQTQNNLNQNQVQNRTNQNSQQNMNNQMNNMQNRQMNAGGNAMGFGGRR